jgi:poly(3-hydroxybutyrate) depolymerase
LGLSSGAYFANQLGCARATVFAAIVAVEGGGPFGECEGTVDAMIVHDPDDPVVPASEGKASLDHWLAADACAAKGAAEAARPGERCIMHTQCGGGRRVAACRASGGLHGLAPGIREDALSFIGLR